MIDFVVVPSGLRPHVLDTRVKRGEELSTDHHLVVSWIREWGKILDRPGKPKRVVWLNWERLEEAPVLWIFNSHLWQSFSSIPVEVGGMEPELVSGPSNTVVDTVVREAVRLPQESFEMCFPGRLLRQVQGTDSKGRSPHQSVSGQHLRRVKRGGTIQAVYRKDGTEEGVGCWKERFEELLNPTNTYVGGKI